MPHVTFAQTNTWVGSGEGRVNEDFAVIDQAASCAVLVDGATGLTKVNLIADETDASWYAHELACRTAALLSDPTTPTTQALAQAGRSVANDYLRLPGATDLNREDLPNGGVAILRWTASQLEVVMLGDCTAAVAMRNGATHVVHDPTLDAFDRQNYERMHAYATTNDVPMSEARRALNDRFIENRLKMNKPDGYWAADITCRGFGHELVRRFPIEQVTGMFTCSDGFFAAVEMGVCTGARELARRVLAGEGARVAADLRAAEQADKDLTRVHRSKVSDDATYAAIAFA